MSLKKHADFNRLWAGQTISNLGDKISVLGLPTVAVLVLGGGAMETGIIGTLRFLPFLIFGPLAGLVADRMSRRSIMIIADIGRMLAIGSLPLAFALGYLTMAHLYIVAGVVGILTVFFEIAYQAWLPSLVGKENLVEGNTKLQISRSVAEALGAGLGGAFMQLVGAARALTIDAVTFLVSMISLLLIRTPEQREKHDMTVESVRRDLMAGYRDLIKHPILQRLFASNVIVNFGAAVGDAVLIVFAYRTLDLTAGQVGIAYAVMAVFVIIGAVTSEQITARLGVGRSIITAGMILGVGYALVPLFGTHLGFTGLIMAQALIGLVSPIFDIHVLSLVQVSAPEEKIGRISGSALSAVYGALALGYLVGGSLGKWVGLQPALVIAGAAAVLGAATLLLGPVARIHTMPVAEEAPNAEETDDYLDAAR